MIVAALLLQALGSAAAGSSGACVLSASAAQVASTAARSDAPANVLASCGALSVSLGKASSYAFAANVRLRSMVVVLRDPLRTRVELVSLTSTGTLQVQDVTRDLARAAGLYPDAGLGSLEPDLAQFPANGTITVRSSKTSTAASSDANQSDLPAVEVASASAAGATSTSTARSRTLDLAAYFDGGTAQ